MSEIPGSIIQAAITTAARQMDDDRQSGGSYRAGNGPFANTAAMTINYVGGGPDTIPRGSTALLWQGSAAASDAASVSVLDFSARRYVIFTVAGSAKLYAAPQETWSTVAASSSVIGLEYAHWSGWQRWQYRAPTSKCFNPAAATISLVAGATSIASGGTDSTFGNTDGPLGTNTLANPTAIAYNPVDGCIYFIDAGTSTFVRKLDPVTGIVSTTAINSITFNAIRASGGFTIDQNGEFYFLCQDTTDSNNPFITRVSADGATETQIWHTNPFDLNNQISGCTDLSISKDGVYVYFGGAPIGYGSGAVAQPYHMLRAPTHSSFGTNTGLIVAGNNQTSSLRPGDAPFVNLQGEGVDPLTGRVDGAMNYYTAPSGELYTWSQDTWMVRKIAADFSRIDSVTNHSPLDSSGFPQPGFGGDGLPAFTLGDNTPQFGSTCGIAIDTCGNVLLGDGIVRYVDTSGILNSLLGDPLGSPATWPTATPQLVSACFNPYSMQRICYDPVHAAVYFTAFYWDGANVSENAIFKVEGA